jgi:hypothetical protein
MPMPTAWMMLLLQATTATVAPLPFGVGERLEYGGKFSLFNVGTASLEVEAIEPMRGAESWRFAFDTDVTINAGVYKYKSRSALRSWTGVDDWISRQFSKHVVENDRERREIFRIYPDSGFFRRNENTETKPTPAAPLDDIAFIYWVRTIPLEVGRTYRFNNYFRAEHNPVIVRVEKRETKEMPDGTKVRTLLLRPIVNEEGGMFHERARAKLWLTDDARRIPMEIESTYGFGTVRLLLRRVTMAPGGG